MRGSAAVGIILFSSLVSASTSLDSRLYLLIVSSPTRVATLSLSNMRLSALFHRTRLPGPRQFQLSSGNPRTERRGVDPSHLPAGGRNGVAVIQGTETVQMIRKGQALGTTRPDRHGQAGVFGSLPGVA